jgi:hypothetical protein
VKNNDKLTISSPSHQGDGLELFQQLMEFEDHVYRIKIRSNEREGVVRSCSTTEKEKKCVPDLVSWCSHHWHHIGVLKILKTQGERLKK